MTQEGISPSDIDAFFNGTLSAPTPSAPLPLATPPVVLPVVDERFAKYEKMRKMLPEGAVRQKMTQEGFSLSDIDTFFNTSLPTSVSTSGGDVPPTVGSTPIQIKPVVPKPAPAPVPQGPVKPKRKTRVKMRDFFWSQLPDNKVESTMWTELNDEKVVLNLDELDKLFEQKEDSKEEKTTTGSEKKESEKPKEIVLITDANRQRNVNIFLSRLRMSYDDLKVAIYSVDETILHVDMIQTLINMVPTAEEIEIVQVSAFS